MKKRMIFIAIILVLIIGTYLFMHTAKFGKNPSGADLERVQQSVNYRDGQFQNLQETPALTGGANYFTMIYDALFKKDENLKPSSDVPTSKTNLKELDSADNLLVWMGHGSYYMQLDGKKILVDPVLVSASPISWFGGAFKGSTVYKPADMPKVDYLFITHDHWDHLDYNTLQEIRHDSLQVICPLGVGSHFRHWGFKEEQLTELDWNDSTELANGIKLHALPTRHFSGRTFSRNKTLWAAYMLQRDGKNIFLSGDGGYGTHFKAIKARFGAIDFAVFENGQYNYKWANIHLMPDDLKQALDDIAPQRFITVHNSKYALANHDWREPMENVYAYTQNASTKLLTPMIGEVVQLDTLNDYQNAWWR